MKKAIIDRLLQTARQAAPEVESAVSQVQDSHLRGVIAGVIMEQILAEVVSEHGASPAAETSASSGETRDQLRKGGTQGRVLSLQGDRFFTEPRRLEQVLEELRIRGYHHNKSDVRMSLLRLARKRALRRIALGEGRQRTYLYVDP